MLKHIAVFSQQTPKLPGDCKRPEVRETEVRAESIKSLLKIQFCEVGFLEELEKFEFSSDDEHLFWLRITLVLFLKNIGKWFQRKQ